MKVAVVGAGVGGLAAAIELAAAGHAVTVFEREATPPAASARACERGGFVWDAGPVAADHAVGVQALFAETGSPLASSGWSP